VAVQVKLTSVKKLSSVSTAAMVELSNFNFTQIASAVREFLVSISYQQGVDAVSVDINTISADTLNIRNGLSVYGAQLESGNYPKVIELDPSGSIISKNIILEDVVDARRVRLRVFGLLPSVGIPGELVYIGTQLSKSEGIYVWLNSTGWTLLAGGNGVAKCMQEVSMTATSNVISADNSVVSPQGLFLFPAPLAATGFLLFVNGHQITVGNSDLTAPAYLSKDAGVTASSFNEVDVTDQLYWNPSVAGFNLDTSDTITLRYFTEDPYCSQTGYTCITGISSSSTTTWNQFTIQIIGTPTEPGPITICKIPNLTTGSATLPTGYSLSNTILSYTISDPTGIYPTGAIIKFKVPQSLSEAEFNLIKIFHEVDSVLVDETVKVGDIVGDLYIPNYASRLIYAQVDSFSPFYLIQGQSITTTTSSTSTTTTLNLTTTTTCAPNLINYLIPSVLAPTQITFYGTPAGPFNVVFTDSAGGVHDLTGITGSMIRLGWNFNLNNPNYSGIPSTVGTYIFTNSSNCSYTISVPVPELNTTTTTTQAYAGGTTSTSTTTTTTASCANSLTATPNPFNNPATITFVGSPIGPYSVMFTELDSGIQYYLGAGIKTPWVFDRKNYYLGAINSSYGTYKFISPICTINIPVIRATTSTSTTSTSTSTTSTSTSTTSTTSTTTAAPTSTSTTTSTTTAEPTTTSTTSTTTAEPTTTSTTSTTTAEPTTTSTTSTTTAAPTSTTSTTTAAPTSTSTTSTTTIAFQTLTGYVNNNSTKFCAANANSAFTVYTAADSTLASAYANSSPTRGIFSDTALTTLAAAGIYGNSDGGSGVIWYDWSGAAFTATGTCAVGSTTTTTSTTAAPTSTSTTSTTTIAFQTLTGYSNSNSTKFCAGDATNTAVTVYTATQTTLAAAYANSAQIFSDTTLTTLAAAGIYGNSDGGTWYTWNGTAFTTTGTCAGGSTTTSTTTADPTTTSTTSTTTAEPTTTSTTSTTTAEPTTTSTTSTTTAEPTTTSTTSTTTAEPTTTSTTSTTTAEPTTTSTTSTTTAAASPTSTTTTTVAPNTFNVTASGSSAYIINGQSNPTLTLFEEQTYTFNIAATGHPFWIKLVSSTGPYNEYPGITNNGTDNGSISFTVPPGAASGSPIYYNCENHISMAGTINISA
jgi:hypothetical protein